VTVFRGWRGTIQVAGADVAQVEGWAIDVDNSAESHYAVGSRTATDITVGPKNVTGNFSKVWFDDTYADLVNPVGDGKPASFTFYAEPGPGVGVSCTNCIWSTWSGSGENEGYATEDLDFICKNVTT
jgi:hypothetical protein